MWINYNPNPLKRNVGDCAIRALCKALDEDWEKVFAGVIVDAFAMCDMPTANAVWGAFLRQKGFRRDIIPDDAPRDYTVADFCQDHQKGTFVLALSGHVVTAVDGDYYDTWDSGSKIPLYYYYKEDEK